MLYLINLELGNYNEKEQYVIYDDKLNEINYFTELQLMSRIKKGVEIQGIAHNGFNILVHLCKIQNNLGVVSTIKLNNCSNYNMDRVTNLVLLNNPIKLNKIKTGMVFVYKNVKMLFISNRPTSKSCWHLSYYKGLLDNETLRDNNCNVDINSFFRNILEIEPFIIYKIKIDLNLVSLGVAPNYLDFGCLYSITNKRYVSYRLRGSNIKYINIGNINLNRTNLMELTGYLKSDSITIYDFSDCCQDYEQSINIPVGCSSDYDFCLPSSVNDKENIVFLFNVNTPKFIDKYIKFAKLNYLGVLPISLPKERIPGAIEQLKAKRLLMKSLDIKNEKYYIIMK